ncbi:MAG: AcrR family transcriptional regulator [Yoonia sp.]|jgi:AcrR family transcriptional regulator
MSKTARTDDIDEFLTSVRSLISQKEQQKSKAAERLVLQPDQRVSADMQNVDEDMLADVSLDSETDTSNVLLLEPDNPADREGLEATIAELEAAVTAQSGDWEPDGSEDFVEAFWAVSAFEPPKAKTVEAVTQHKNDIPATPQEPVRQAKDASMADELEATVTANVTAGLDADALRALVIATVHEELSGELGERITQNVRKLVRREINRVLANYDIGTE